jgi:hypothetical protein
VADTKISDLAAVTDVLATDEYVLARSSTTKKITAANLSVGLTSSPYVLVRDEKTTGTDGGSAAATTWNVRTLNTEVFDTNGLCSLSANQVTLTAGTYECRAVAPCYEVNRTRLRLRNVTDSATVLLGVNGYTDASDFTTLMALMFGRFTIAASKALELQHYTQVAKATTGLGLQSAATNNTETEVYASIEFWLVG